MKETNRPNILIIHADQHRWDCLGAYGNPDVLTPNIDALAAEGVRYEQSFCPFPVCTPSRYSLLSSQYVHQHLGWTNHCTLAPGIPTFPRVLRDAGYRTTAVGKMHFTPTYLDVGFEEMWLAEQDGPGRFDDDYHRWLRDEGLVDRIDLMDQRWEYRQEAPDVYWETVGALRSDLDEAHHSTTWIADRAMETLASWGEKPSAVSGQPSAGGGPHLLMVGFVKPHHPFDPPAPWDDMYDPDGLALLPGWLEEPLARDIARSEGYFPHVKHTEAKVRRAMAYYYASISQIDHHVGRMIALLKARGLYDNTLIVYTSDHGDYLGFHHLLLKGDFMYDPVVKVPLIIKYPKVGGTQPHAGEVSQELVNNIDVGPTLLGVAGCDVPRSMQGADLATTTGPDGDPDSRPYVFAENWGGQEYMVRSQTHKLLLCRDPEQSQFFDLVADPYEMENRIDDPASAETVATMRDALLRWALFDAHSQVYLDYDAPVIGGDHVPERDDGHVEAMVKYFEEKMAEGFELEA
ncbi:MAG: sulfatase-like hydrolase/transferase [Anaerolineae bacterium]|nr:sulfatase-like hydrolase/transferase [Anaerolineae bacterium]